MNLEHASRFATAQARLAAGPLYPDPWLLPVGQRHALDAVLAVAFGPGRRGGEAFRAGFEQALRGRPDGPLLLALWAAASAAEMPHAELRRLMEAAAEPLPDPPADRAALEAALARRVEPLVRCALSLVQCAREEALAPARDLGLGLGLTALLLDLPAQAAAGRCPWPAASLEQAGWSRAEWRLGLPGAPLQRWLALTCAWARAPLERGRALAPFLGARWRRALDNEVRKAGRLLDQLQEPGADPYRRAPRLRAAARWSGRARALGLLARSVLLPHVP